MVYTSKDNFLLIYVNLGILESNCVPCSYFILVISIYSEKCETFHLLFW